MSEGFQKPPINTKFTSFGRDKSGYEPPKNTYIVGQRREFGGGQKKSKGGVGGSWTKKGVTSKLSGGNASNWIKEGGSSSGGWGTKVKTDKKEIGKTVEENGGFMSVIKPKNEVVEEEKDELTEEDIEKLYTILDYDELEQDI